MEAVNFTDLLTRQQELEDNALAKGAERFRTRLNIAATKGKLSTAGAARKLLLLSIEKLELAITAEIEASKSAMGRKNQAIRWCEMLGADVAAYMTAKIVIDGAFTTKATVRNTANEITTLMMDELRYRRFREMAPGFFDYTISQFHTTSYAHMARSISHTMGHAVCKECYTAKQTECVHMKMDEFIMAPATRLYVGTWLIDKLIVSTGLVTHSTVQTREWTGRKHRVRAEMWLTPEPEAVKWLDARNAALEFLWPVAPPMLVPPLQWSQHVRGGYRFGLRSKFPMVRSSSAQHLQTIASTYLPVVYEALNRIQETAWHINPKTMALVQEIMERGGGYGGIPHLSEEPLPQRPDDIGENEEARKAWRRSAALTHERNHARKIKAKEFLNTYTTALSVKDEKAIFFPMNLDFRGRIYPISNYLTPQGDDLSKALLTFSDTKQLGDSGAVWLALHGANCLGETPEGLKLSKASLQERVDWIVNHTLQIEAVVANPFGNLWWTAEYVDEPLQFYAFCCEWAGYAAMQRLGRGDEYASGLPCAMDGTCNGLQHFAAMLRDEIGGAAVNLVPMDRPQDIYQRMTDCVLDRLESEAGENVLAALWLSTGLVTRKLLKRPTMTFGYGSKRFGFAEQTKTFLMALETWKDVKAIFTEEGKKEGQLVQAACLYMSGLIWDALWQTVLAASSAMDWMQKAARGVSQNGKVVEWTVAKTHFPVRQEYMKVKTSQITTVLAGKTVRPGVYTPTTTPDPIKQANAIAPNFVHSYDAAALMLTVQAAAGDGVEAFGMVHDSYATVAADCGVLAKCTREAFVRLYTQHDVLAELAGQLRPQWKDQSKFPVMPAKGTLDLGGVLVSEYFFS